MRDGGRAARHQDLQATEAVVFVACSTLCFGSKTLAEALRSIGELGFNKIDLALRETGPHLKPSEVAADIGKAAQRLRQGPGLTVAAFHVEFSDGLPTEGQYEQMKAVCRLARVLTTPLVSITAAPLGSEIAAEVERLGRLNRIASSEGVTLTVESTLR